MGTDERHTDSSYNPATSFASECPSCYYCGAPVTGIWCGDQPTCDKCPEYPSIAPDEGFAPLYCKCGVILAPHEVRLDLGDGDELLCDACLGISN